MSKTVTAVFFVIVMIGVFTCRAEDKADRQVSVDQFLDRDGSLLRAAKEALGRYAKRYPAYTTNSVAEVRIDQEPADFSGGLGSPITNKLLTAFVNAQITRTEGGHNEFFVTFRTDKAGLVKSVFVGQRDRMGRGGLGMTFVLRRVKDEYEIEKETDAISIVFID